MHSGRKILGTDKKSPKTKFLFLDRKIGFIDLLKKWDYDFFVSGAFQILLQSIFDELLLHNLKPIH